MLMHPAHALHLTRMHVSQAVLRGSHRETSALTCIKTPLRPFALFCMVCKTQRWHLHENCLESYRHVSLDKPDLETKEAMHLADPLTVTPCKVIIHSDHLQHRRIDQVRSVCTLFQGRLSVLYYKGPYSHCPQHPGVLL